MEVCFCFTVDILWNTFTKNLQGRNFWQKLRGGIPYRKKKSANAVVFTDYDLCTKFFVWASLEDFTHVKKHFNWVWISIFLRKLVLTAYKKKTEIFALQFDILYLVYSREGDDNFFVVNMDPFFDTNRVHFFGYFWGFLGRRG